MKNVIIIGTGGHAKVIAEIIRSSGDRVEGFIDNFRTKGDLFLGLPVLGSDEELRELAGPDIYFILGIGSNQRRAQLAASFDLPWYTAIHPSAVVAPDVIIGCGSVLMPLCVVNPNSVIGEHCIVNTGAIIEHDKRIADYVHLSPRAALAGKVCVGERTHIGIGACVIDGISITSDCVIGAGAAVVRDIDISGTYVGVPVRRLDR